MQQAIIRDVVSQLCCTFRQAVREEMAIVDICMVFICSIAPFSLRTYTSASRHSDSTPGSRRVPLCVHDYRAFRTVQAVLQTAAATTVGCSHELVGGGNGGNSM